MLDDDRPRRFAPFWSAYRPWQRYPSRRLVRYKQRPMSSTEVLIRSDDSLASMPDLVWRPCSRP